MKRIQKIVNGWKADKEIKLNLIKNIDQLFASNEMDESDTLLQLQETKNIFALVKSNFNLEQLIELSLTFSNQLLIARKIKEAEYILNALLAEEISDTIEAEIFLQIADIRRFLPDRP